MQQDADQIDGMPEGKRSPDARGLAYELSGTLPCATCGYNLSGLSVLGRCPECGTLIRDTLLVVVDAFAETVPKVRRPRMIGVAVVAWSGAAFAASVVLIVHRALTMICGTNRDPCGAAGLALVGVACIYAAALFSLGLLRPMRSTSLRASLGAAAASIAMAAGGTIVAITLLVRDPFREVPYIDVGTIDVQRVGEHLVAHALFIAAVLLIRPNARGVSSTSWRLRENHANKQRLLTVAASLAAVIAGDLVLVAADSLARDGRASAAFAGGALVLVGSGVLTAALYGVLADSICIAKTLWRVPVAFRDIVRRAAE